MTDEKLAAIRALCDEADRPGRGEYLFQRVLTDDLLAILDSPSTPTAEPDDALVEQVCEIMHNTYENAAAEAGWSTQEASRKPWSEVPEANKATMAKFEAAGQGKIVSGEYERAQKTLATAYTANKQTGVKGALKRVR